MSINNVLMPIDVNVNAADMSSSPVFRKRARYTTDSASKDQWSLSRNGLTLDDVYDYGVRLLDSGSEVDKDGQLEPENFNSGCPTESDLTQINVESPTTPKWLTNKDWEDFISKKPESEDSCCLPKYFSCLSDEIVLHIFRFLPKSHLSTAALVCSQWHRLAADDSLWARLDASGRCILPGAIGHILSRQVVILRLASVNLAVPTIIPATCRASSPSFRARLMYLDLSMAHVPSPNALIDILARCRFLKKVSLEQVSGLDDEVMLALSQSKDLQVLNLAMASGMTETGMKYLLGNCHKLRELNLAWTNLSKKCVTYICGNLPKSLDRLNISGCRKLINDSNICDLVESCPGLRELDLSDCNALSSTAVSHLTRLHELNFLAASRCYAVPPRALLQLKELPDLVYLDIHGTYISAEEIDTIQEGLGSRVNINKFKFSSVARPTTGGKRSSIWNLRVRD